MLVFRGENLHVEASRLPIPALVGTDSDLHLQETAQGCWQALRMGHGRGLVGRTRNLISRIKRSDDVVII